MIPGIVLAGGKSSRMGRPKALLPVGSGGERFLDRIVGTLAAAGIDGIYVVVGADAAAIRRSFIPGAGVHVIDNPDYEAGQLTSLIAGLRALPEPAEAALVTLVDVPLVTAHTVRTVLDAYRTQRPLIARPVSRGRHGHPVIFDRGLFDELRRADPSVGAKAVVRAHAAELLDVPVDDEGAFVDIDTPQDYAAIGGTGEHLVLFDGQCGLCDGVVQFLLARDLNRVFTFAALQSEPGRAAVARAGGNPDQLTTIYVVRGFRSASPTFLAKSDAALFLVDQLGGMWRLLAAGRLLPRPLRDVLYDVVARYRYVFFGRYEQCIVPTPESRSRFLE